ncbi:MAG: tetratricopeptide repeat protein, partial [Pseudomonadales bacterium]|nr:tetratricopeptide repeat protein [Pseudomonadales bacterium]
MSHSSYRVVGVILVSLWSAGCSLLPLFEPGSPDVIPDPLRADDSSVTLGAWLDSEEVSKKASHNDAGQMLSAPGYEPTNNKQGGHDSPRDSVSVRLTVIESYQQLLPLLSSHGETRNNAVRGQTQAPSIEALEALIEQRLAELKMSVSEAVFADDAVESNSSGQIRSPEIPSAFDAAIQVYQDLIAKYPDHPSAPSHWYQLAKGLEMVARREESIAALSTLVSRYPESEYTLEAYFRLGEHFFREGQFDRAHQAFSQVVERVEARLVPGDDPEVSYYPVAKYMVGWSEFKQQQTDEALVSFIEALDILLKPESIGQSMTLEAFRATLPETRQSLILDLFRVIAIGIDNLPEGAPNGLTRLFDTTGEKPYEHLIYEWLATGYMEKQRFFDAVAMYQEYIHRYPNAYPSPVFQKASVDVLEQAGFYEDAWTEKATFVSLYGHGSLIWAQFKAPDDGPVFPEYLNTLNGYLKALAKHQHYHAQQAEIANRQEAAQFYRKAIRYYEDLLRGFPEDAQRSEFSFFLGDSYFALEEFPRAIEAFEQVAYGYPLSDFSADAGFNVLHAFERQVESVAAENTVAVVTLQAEQLDSSTAFITHFEADSRRGEVTKKAMALALS